jgi:hypothetical protein
MKHDVCIRGSANASVNTFEQQGSGRRRRTGPRITLVLALVVVASPACARAAQVQAVLTESEQASVLKYAQAEGTVSSLEATHSSSALAASEEISGETQPSTSALANAQVMASTPVDVVVLYGHFVEGNFPTPQGSPTPEGTVLEVVMNRLTGEAVASHLAGRTTTTLAGEVQRQSFRPTVAQIARLRHLRILARRTRTRPHKGRRDAHAANWGTENRCGDKVPEHCYAAASVVLV